MENLVRKHGVSLLLKLSKFESMMSFIRRIFRTDLLLHEPVVLGITLKNKQVKWNIIVINLERDRSEVLVCWEIFLNIQSKVKFFNLRTSMKFCLQSKKCYPRKPNRAIIYYIWTLTRYLMRTFEIEKLKCILNA